MSEENNMLESTSIPKDQSKSQDHSGYSFWAQQVSAHNNAESFTTTPPLTNEAPPISSEYHYNETKTETISGPIKKKHGLFKRTVALVSSAALFGVVAAGSFLGFNEIYYHTNPDKTPPSLSFSSNITSTLSNAQNHIAATTVSKNTSIKTMDVSDIVTNVMPSMVAITSTFVENYSIWGQQYQQENDGGGSGIIIEQNDSELLIATNNHVVSSAKAITVTFIDGTTATAVIKGVDSSADLAVISVDYKSLSDDTKKAIDVAKLGKSDDVKVGQMVIAIGNALGYGQTVTVGYVSAKDREITPSDSNAKLVVLQVDAAINPGNSGGALLNVNGEVIGINSAKISDSSIEGIGYSIPITRALPIVNDLKTKEILADDEKGYLGIMIQDVTKEYAEQLNWPIGVYISDVVKDSSADKGGLLVGDIITEVNDSTVTTSDQLREKVTSYRVGTTINVTYQRRVDGVFKEYKTSFTLMKNPTLTAQTEQSSQDGTLQQTPSEELPNNTLPPAENPSADDNSNRITPYEGTIPEDGSEPVNPFDVFGDFFNQLP